MVLIPLVRDYIDRMLHDVSGMKVLILDPQTVRTSSPKP
jgi:vacuolar protein sorting-associated protein 45